MAILPMLIEHLMTRGQRAEQIESMNLQQEQMKLQQKQINLNIKEKQQMLDAIDSLGLSRQEKAGISLNPKIGGLLLSLSGRGQEFPQRDIAAEKAIPQEFIPKQPSLIERITQGQLGAEGIGGILGDVLYKELGIGRSSEIVTTETLQHPETGEMVRVPRTRSGQYKWELSQPAPPELTTETITQPSGAQSVMLYDKLRGFRPGGIQIMQKAPAAVEKPIKETSLPLWVHPQTLESPSVGTSQQQAEQQGYRRVSTEAKNRIDAAKGMKEVLVKLGELMKQVFPEKGGLRERMTGAPSRMLGARTQYDPNAAQLESFINGTVAPIIRSFGEKGNLSETDVKRAINLMPKITDSADVAWGKFNNLIELINNIQASAVGGKPGLSLKPSGKKAKPLLKPKKEDPLGLR